MRSGITPVLVASGQQPFGGDFFLNYLESRPLVTLSLVATLSHTLFAVARQPLSDPVIAVIW